MHGRRALILRREPIVSAYRVFFRQIGLDPDQFNTPMEAAVLERLRAGGFKSQGLVDDALTIGTVETGVALRALDAGRINGVLGLRLSQPGERLGGKRNGLEMPSETLVVADEKAAVGLIFGDTADDWEVTSRTEQIAICAIEVQGVPSISVEEAIWSCAGVLSNSASAS
jgi:DNA/RNA-binding domain of Phe-tRNA-synthetase-like protein